MVEKPAVRSCDKPLVEALLATARLVACDQDDGVPPRIERERRAPLPVRSREPRLLRVGAFQAFERVDVGPTKLRAEFGE